MREPLASWPIATKDGTPAPRWYSERTVWPGPFGRDHEHVEVGPRLDQAEMDVEAVGEGERRALAQPVVQVFGIKLGLQLVGGSDHHHVGPVARLVGGDDSQPGGFPPS